MILCAMAIVIELVEYRYAQRGIPAALVRYPTWRDALAEWERLTEKSDGN